MYSLKKALKIISYISVGIVLMLFFLFVNTYDFEGAPKDDVLTDEELMESIKNSIDDARENITPFNECEFILSESLISDILNYLIAFNDEEILYETKYWSLSRLYIDMEKNNLCLTIYADFKDKINYKLKLKAYFDLSYQNDSIILQFDKFLLGSIEIPHKVVSYIIKKNDEETIGFLIKNTLKSLYITDIDTENLIITISKDKFINSMIIGSIGDLIFSNEEATQKAGAMYVDYFIDINNFTFLFDEETKLVINLSKIINVNDTLLTDNDIEEYNNLKEVKSGSLTNPGVILSERVKSLFDSGYFSILEYKYSKITVDDEYIYLKFGFSILNCYSEIMYKVLINNNKYIIEEVTIGKDNEEVNSYAIIDIAHSTQFLNTLGINVLEDEYEINISDLFKIDGLELKTINISENNINLTYKD